MSFFKKKKEKLRSQSMEAEARRLSLGFYVDDPFDIPNTYYYMNKLGVGDRRRAFNILNGSYKGQNILFFDYELFEERPDENTYQQLHKIFSVAIVELSGDFPELVVRPEARHDKAIQAFGFEDIDFDNYEFSRKFMVKCKSQKFAYDVFHTRMMEIFLEFEKVSVNISRNTMMISLKREAPEYLGVQIDRLVRIKEALPRYLFEGEGGSDGSDAIRCPDCGRENRFKPKIDPNMQKVMDGPMGKMWQTRMGKMIGGSSLDMMQDMMQGHMPLPNADSQCPYCMPYFGQLRNRFYGPGAAPAQGKRGR